MSYPEPTDNERGWLWLLIYLIVVAVSVWCLDALFNYINPPITINVRVEQK